MKNLVLLTIDTLRKDVLGCYGNPAGLTPFIDFLADKSVIFTQAHSIAPYTQASFPGILTSSYLFDHPKSEQLSGKRTIIAEPLKKAGITTAAFHSNPYLCAYFGWNRGWDQFYDSMEDEVSDMNPYIKGDVINQKLDVWLSSTDGAKDDKPLFLWTHYMDVHEPYVPAKKYIDLIDSSINLSDDDMFSLFKDVVLKRDNSVPDTVELLRKLYCAHVREIDDYTKSFFSILNKHNILEDSIVIITTDHGEEFGEHGGISHDGKMYSELVGVPLLVYGYDGQNTRVCDTLVSGLDISPTIVNLFGLEAEDDFQGQALLPLDKYQEKGCYGESIGKLSHKVKETDRPVYYYREKNLKIIYRAEEDAWQMYDLQSDPQELNNVIDTAPQAVAMKEKLQPRINRAEK